ncbi:MAG: hypothetical protein JWN93_394 [Hyphomicrobiales bacterium]|nr:hypothetical protein [Hyphomicrobiales bacterium]
MAAARSLRWETSDVAVSLALEAALALARNPVLAAVMRNQPLPTGVETVLRIVSGDESALQEAASQHRVEPAFAQMAAELYVEQALLFPGAAPNRVLGLGANAARDEMRAHMRLLLLWLHPDRGPQAWRTGFAGRVIDAWRDVSRETGESAGQGTPQPARRSRGRRPTRWLRQPVPVRPSRQARRRTRRRRGVAVALALLAGGGVAWFVRENPLVAAQAFQSIMASLQEAAQ